MKAEDEAERYRRAWRTLRWRLVLGFFSWCGPSVLLFLLNGMALTSTGHGLPNRVVTPIALVGMALFVISAFRLALWPCPRCGRAFSGGYAGPFAKRCTHCGLLRNATSG